jgi:hypothetical protein
MSNVVEDILHTLIDVAAGRRNLPPHQADELHEQITPGHTDVPLSAEEQAQMEALQARQERLAQAQADREQAAAAPAPVAEDEPEPAEAAPAGL